MANIPKVGLYVSMVDTSSGNKVGLIEQEHRNNTNSIADILNAAWSSWTPTVAYSGTTVPLKSQIGRYIQVGSTVFFDYMQTGPGNTGVSVTDISLTLPIEPKTGTSRYIPLTAIEYHGATYQDPMAYIDTIATGLTAGKYCVRFRNFLSITTSAYRLEVSGRYEVT